MIRPTNGNILIEPILSKDTTEGGLYLPDQAKGYIFYGNVIDKCDTVRSVSIGQRVAYKSRSCYEISEDGKTYFIATEEDIFGRDCGEEKIAMIGDHLLVKQVRSRMSPGGTLFLPERRDEDEEFGMNTSQIGVVCALDSKCTDKIKPGDWICFESGFATGFPVRIGGEEYRVINERSIMFTIEVEK